MPSATCSSTWRGGLPVPALTMSCSAAIITMVLLCTTAVETCRTDFDCQLNGECIQQRSGATPADESTNGNGTQPQPGDVKVGICHCDPGWEGDACGVLKLMSTPPTAFFRQEGVATWGGGVLYDEQSKLWHMWHSEIAGNCTLSEWRTTSQVRHATAPSGLGPWTAQDIVISPEAHNPQVVRLKDGTLILFDSYGGYPSQWMPCGNSSRDHSHPQPEESHIGKPQPPPCVDAGPGNLTIHVLSSSSATEGLLGGQVWQKKSVPITYPCRSCNLTPSPVLVNDTLYVMLHCDADKTHSTCDLVMVRSETPTAGPYEAVNSRVWSSSEAPGHPEDPGMWVDRRGNWHALLHNGPHGVHLWSNDSGQTFHTTNQPPWPFSVDVTVSEGTGTIMLSRRERPVMVLNDNGLPSILVTSAELGTSRYNTFTLTQMIDTSAVRTEP